jgi:hypothetical protein
MKRLSRRSFVTGLAPSFLAAGLAAAQDVASSGTEPKQYFSDYFSFVGRDEAGYVFLAHDNNRGRTGDRYFADHWIAMYDDATGWVDVKGSAHYPNTSKTLADIPDSEHFSFSGSRDSGMRISGASNDLTLTVGALPRTLYRQNGDGVFWVGGAPAVLQWKDRKLVGRVLFEYLERNNWNRFTADFGANWQNFNGLYLLTSTGADFYAHFHERQGGSDLNGRLVGLASWSAPAPLTELNFKIPGTVTVPGRTYRCPSRWQVDFEYAEKAWRLDLDTAHRQHVADWEKGGFFMATVQGQITARDGSETHEVIGWAELLL